MDTFKSVKHHKVYLEIAEQITDAIARKEYKSGDKLPSERRLSELTMASRSSIREALSVLDAIGIIEIKAGQGTFVSHSLEIQSFNFKENESPHDLLEARKTFESSIVNLINIRATPKHLKKLKETITKMEAYSAGEVNLNECYEYGIEFHRILASLAGNDVIEKIGCNLLDSSNHPMSKLLNRRALYSNDVKNKQIQEHKAILKALQTKDDDLAKKKIEEHLDNLQTDMFT